MRKKNLNIATPDFDELEDRPSKTELKKAMVRLQQLGEKLADLRPEQIQKLPVSETLIDNLLELQRISSFEARRRQFQLIGKLLKHENESDILAVLNIQQPAKKQAQVQRWIERMIEQGDNVIQDFVRQFPAAERHTLRQHVLRAQKAILEQASDAEQAGTRLQLENYVQQVVVLSE